MKNRKSVVALLLVAIIGIVGLTVAYFSNSTSITNEFETSEYGTDVTETFTSPTGWQPGDETPKVLTVKNTGEVDEAVRVKVEEKWVNKNGQELSLTQDGNVAALIHYINDSDWTRVDVANEDYYYYYYNYKLAPEEETSELLDKVIFNPLINASTTCTTTTENGVTTRSCKSNGSGYDGATYTLKFTIETVQYNKYADAWNVDVAIAEEKPHPATQFLAETATNPRTITSYNDTNADKGKMFYFTHTLNAGTENEKIITETRYICNDPKNYVYFNCVDPVENEEYDYATSCEVWRILGVFDVEKEVENPENAGQTITVTEQRMKLVRGKVLDNKFFWDSNIKNDWTTATLKTYLNTDYYNSLQTSAKGMIDEAKYYLGAVSYIDSTSGCGTTEKIYGEERGTTVCGACNGDNSKLTWLGNIGLMYISDAYMVYSMNIDDTCYTNPWNCQGNENSWISMSNRINSIDIAVVYLLNSQMGKNDGIYYTTGAYNRLSSAYSGPRFSYITEGQYIRPVVYLSSNVQIFDGDGSINSPYKLK